MVEQQDRTFRGSGALMGSWQTLFATQAGVGAALTGLVFVALSINLKQILALPGLANRAGEALLLLLLPVINGLVGVLPQTSTRALGGELLGIATVLWVIVSWILFTGHKAVVARPALEFVTRTLAAQFAVVPAIVAGCLLLVGNSSGMWWQAAAMLLCIVASVADAWVLLVEILR
jgi:hypothetical protein